MDVNTSGEPNIPSLKEERSLLQQNFTNVPYGKNPLQVMDIYLPAGRSATSTKSLILVHGGGWTAGSKADFCSYIESFKSRLSDYAIFNVSYRLVSGGYLFPTQENDVKAAIDFIAAHTEKYSVRADGFVLLGVSAGAHLALLHAYKNASPKINAVIDYFAPTDLVAMYTNPWHPLVLLALQMVTGTTPALNETLYRQWSPLHYISAAAPPTLILHGAKDQVVDVSQSIALSARLQEFGVPQELQIYPAEGHGKWFGPALVSSFDRIEVFLNTHVP